MAAIAGQTHDLVIAGDGYMLAQSARGAAHYKRALDGPVEIGLTPGASGTYEVLQGSLDAPVQPFRRAIWSKWSGLGQGMVAGADGWQQAQTRGKVNDMVGLRPVQDGGALALCPQGVDAQVDAAALALSGASHFCVALGNVQVVSFGAKIFVSASPGTNNSGFVLKATASGNIAGMCLWNNQVLVSVAGTLNYFNTATGAFTAFSPAQPAGILASYQGGLLTFNNNQLLYLCPGSAAWAAGPTFENAVTAVEELNGALYIGTHTALYRLQGQFKPKSPSTAPAVLDYFDFSVNVVWRTAYFNVTNFIAQYNFACMAAWQGYLWFFAGGRLYRAAPVQGADTMKPQAQPVFGACVGLRVCGNLLVVITQQVSGGVTTVWANDGNYDQAEGLGWFKLFTGGYQLYPFPNAGYSQGMVNALIYNPAASHVFTRWLVDPLSPVGFKSDNYGVTRAAVTGKVTLPLVTPEDLAQLAGATNGKVLTVNLRRVGLEWSLMDGGAWWPALPIDGATLAVMQIGIEVSLNSGLTWETLVEPTLGHLSINAWWFNGHRMELPVTAAFYNPPYMYPASPPSGPGAIFYPVTDMGWQVRVTWGGLMMPLLRRVWLDYDIAEVQPHTGRSWQFEVNLSDPQVGLNGLVEVSPDDATGKAGRLWNLAASGDSTTFTDLDGQSYRVRVAGFEQRRAAPGALPGLAPEWSGTVKLAEVWPGN